MREIKFRGKRNNDGRWVQGYYVESPYDDIYMIDKRNRHHDVIPATIGQYTGLKSKSGQDIYEGDIVKIVALSNDHYQRGATLISSVDYIMGNACLATIYMPIYPFILDHDIEVIGNIYENLELLGVE